MLWVKVKVQVRREVLLELMEPDEASPSKRALYLIFSGLPCSRLRVFLPGHQINAHMELLSSAVSVGTVIQLVGELGESVLDIKKFISRVSHASSEVCRLAELCAQVHGLLRVLDAWLKDGQILSSQGHCSEVLPVLSKRCRLATRS